MSSSEVAPRVASTPAVIGFGPFRFHAVRRELVGPNGPLRIGSRALQLLEVLLESPGRLYSREELVERVWPRTVVEDTSLRVHMSALRRLLGDGVEGTRYIANVPGRGYAFVAPTREILAGEPAVVSAPPATSAASTAPSLPSRLTRTIGREQVIAGLADLLARERLVSVVGAGGMGKTTVALSVAERLQANLEHGVFLVDLSRISDPGFVVVEFGQSHGLNISQGDPPTLIEDLLRDKRVLLVVDNCEHVIDAVAGLVDRLLRACPFVRVITTSREPLQIESEWVYKLPPLEAPDPQERLDVADVLAYPAIQLFVDRAKAICVNFELTDATAPAARQLCQFLDGIPLAIELAAARVDSLGVQGLASRLESVFELLTRGRRTALSRHRTLEAVLDWSYELLSESERLVLQRLSVFRGAFDLEGAVTVASDAELPRQRVIDDVLSLCAKSLIALETPGDETLSHRLLYITRLYAERRLVGRPEAHDVHRRHAAFVFDRLLKRQQAGIGMYHYAWSPALDSGFADLRAAIEWAMVQENDLHLGLDLTARALRSYRDIGLVEEYRHHVALALTKLSRVTVDRERLEMGLRVASAFMTGFATDQGSGLNFLRTRELVDSVGSVEDKIESVYGMCVALYGQGEYRQALALCDEIRHLATGEFQPLSVILADRLACLCLHAVGQHDKAEQLAYRVMSFNGAPIGRRFLSEVPFGSSMRAQLARIQWLRGDFSMAWTTLLEALAHSVNAHFFARCQVLGTSGILLAIWKGELATADQWTTDLLEVSQRKQVPYWEAYAQMYRRVLDGDEFPPGSDALVSLEKYPHANDAAAVLRGKVPSAVTINRVEQGIVGWCAPEILRLAAMPDLASPDPSVRRQAVAGLEHALQIARGHGASFWMLRILLTLCSANVDGPSGQAARQALRSIMADKDDGSDIAELVVARALLEGPA
jgi:predicted ATPase/DNA-binding winged helix-turn-helix (wHTH) protein